MESEKNEAALTSIAATILVVGLLPIAAPRGQRARWLREWFSFWGPHPTIPPDEVHSRAFEAWLRAGYPLLAVTAIILWLVSEQWPDVVSPVPFFTVLFFGVSSGLLHFALSMAVTREASTSTRVLAGWPTELALLVPSTALALAIFR